MTLAGVTCPRCQAAHEGITDKLGWATCRKCAYCWQLVGAKPPAPAPAVPLPPPPAAAKPSRAKGGASGEYSPDDSLGSRSLTKPLSVRPGATPSGRNAVIGPAAVPLPPPAKSSEGHASHPSRAAAPAVGQDVDSQLFERVEEDARKRQSMLETIAAKSGGSPKLDQVSCPVCGHRFHVLGDPPATYQTCPQCSTTFNLDNGQIAGGDGDTNQGPDGQDFLIGKTIRGCYIDRKIGEGGMGSVYHARQLSLDRSVALKVMPADLARNRNFIQRFEREAKSLAKINHPNILHIYDFGEDHALGIYFMIIEFVDGKDLGEILRERHTINQLEVLDIVRQALLGMEMAAEKGVIHRDIKPDNLMVSGTGTCKVSDFGLAKGYGSLDEVTSAGVRVGTPAFMSPEQCDGAEIDFRSDVYSLGCTSYLALTGSLPFSGDSPFSIMLKHKTDPPPSMRVYNAEIDPRLDQLVQRMLAKRPDERCNTLRQLIDVVEELQISLAGGQLPRKNTGERPRSLNDSGAVKLLPGGPGLPPVADLPPEGARASSAQMEAPVNLELVDPGTQLPLNLAKRPSPRPAVPTPPAPAPPSPGQNARYASSGAMIVAQADEAVAGGRSTDAINAYQAALRKRPASRELQSKLADARKQQRHGEVDEIEAKGDSFEAGGHLDRAVDEWLRASQMSSQMARREKLLRKVDAAQQRGRRKRIVRRSFGALVLFLLGLVNLYVWPPFVHNFLANRDLVALPMDGTPPERLQALRAYLGQHAGPYPWYMRIFQRGYLLPPVTEAERRAHEIEQQLIAASPADLAGRELAVIAEVERLRDDPAVPWTQVAERAHVLAAAVREPARVERLQATLDQLKGEITAMQADHAAVMEALRQGRHDQALALAKAFRTRHPRSGAMLASMPLPARLVLTVDGDQGQVEGMRVLVDGIELAKGQRQIARHGERPTVVDVVAPGFVAEKQTIAPSLAAEEIPVAITLRPGKAWEVRLPDAGTWTALGLRSDGVLMLHGAQRLLAVDPRTGEQLGGVSRADVPVPVTGAAAWTLIQEGGAGALLAASSDGLVARLLWQKGRAPAFEALVLRTTAAVVSFHARELVYQSGRMAFFTVERDASGSQLVARTADGELWRRKELRAKLAPHIASLDDRLYVVDDSDIHIFEEDGSGIGAHALSAQRIGPVVPLDQGRVLAVPTAEGIDLVRLAQQALEPVLQPNLSRVGACAIAARGNHLLVAEQRGRVHLLEWDQKLRENWAIDLAHRPVARSAVSLEDRFAVVVDGQGTLHVLARADGDVVRRIDHGRQPALAPVAGTVAAVLDVDGVLTGYFMPR